MMTAAAKVILAIPPTKQREGPQMSNKANNQSIHCSVESCQHHAIGGMCQLSDIQVTPKQNCCNGKADESQCNSYKCRW